jgi:hypothetical protein
VNDFAESNKDDRGGERRTLCRKFAYDALADLLATGVIVPPSANPGSDIVIVYSEFERETGEKSILGASQRLVDRIGTVSSNTLARNLESFCEQVGEAFDGVSAVVKNYQLDTVEITVEVSAKGEVRLVGSASTELRGGLKLIFSRQTPSSQR